MIRVFDKLEPLGRLSRPAIIAICVLQAGLLYLLDIGTGYELSFSIFYLVPVMTAGWFAGHRTAWGISALCAFAWVMADLHAGHAYSNSLIPAWNSLMGFAIFGILSYFIVTVKRLMEHERVLARTDTLTGVYNRRYFYELAEAEIERSRRYAHPLTIAYIDLDNFKQVNDMHGHDAGDQLLISVVWILKEHIRTTDTLARLGGDEFAVLLPETDRTSAEAALGKVMSKLREYMQREGWPVTLSVGSITCKSYDCSLKELVGIADGLMYKVKTGGKDAVRYAER